MPGTPGAKVRSEVNALRAEIKRPCNARACGHVLSFETCAGGPGETLGTHGWVATPRLRVFVGCFFRNGAYVVPNGHVRFLSHSFQSCKRFVSSCDGCRSSGRRSKLHCATEKANVRTNRLQQNKWSASQRLSECLDFGCIYELNFFLREL